jgi:hypothetical protein
MMSMTDCQKCGISTKSNVPTDVGSKWLDLACDTSAVYGGLCRVRI